MLADGRFVPFITLAFAQNGYPETRRRRCCRANLIAVVTIGGFTTISPRQILRHDADVFMIQCILHIITNEFSAEKHLVVDSLGLGVSDPEKFLKLLAVLFYIVETPI